LHCAIDLQRALTRREGELDIHVRIGLHTGEVLREAGSFFGKTVIQAFRVADLAAGGEILSSALTRELAQSAGDIPFGEPHSVTLKGLEGSHTVYAVEWRAA
jgi:class 3 adenylate cyclase